MDTDDADERSGPVQDESSGRFTESYSDEAFIDALDELGGAASTSDVADELGCPHRTALDRLGKLDDADAISSRMVGRSKLWLPPDD